LSGSQWKTSRCSQYSVRVQTPIPATVSPISAQAPKSALIPSHSIPKITGMKITAGTAGWTREKKLRNSLLKSGGEAESFSLRFE
jgi:hypothetical protein